MLELLVVLVIIGIALSSFQGFLHRGGSPMSLDLAANTLADALRKVRHQAILENRDSHLVIDIDDRRFWRDSNPVLDQLDNSILLDMVTARREQTGQRRGRIRFFSDGSSTGGNIGLTNGRVRKEIKVDWLTGAVSIVDHVP